MTQLEAFRVMLASAGVVFTQEKGSIVSICAQAGPHNDGYSDFYADFEFDYTGALVRVGIWE